VKRIAYAEYKQFSTNKTGLDQQKAPICREKLGEVRKYGIYAG